MVLHALMTVIRSAVDARVVAKEAALLHAVTRVEIHAPMDAILGAKKFVPHHVRVSVNHRVPQFVLKVVEIDVILAVTMDVLDAIIHVLADVTQDVHRVVGYVMDRALLRVTLHAQLHAVVIVWDAPGGAKLIVILTVMEDVDIHVLENVVIRALVFVSMIVLVNVLPNVQEHAKGTVVPDVKVDAKDAVHHVVTIALQDALVPRKRSPCLGVNIRVLQHAKYIVVVTVTLHVMVIVQITPLKTITMIVPVDAILIVVLDVR